MSDMDLDPAAPGKRPLPVVDPTRSEFGYERTVCACTDCTANCRHIPGYLVPADLERLRRQLAPDLLAWAQQHLLASPGAIVLNRGRLVRIPTLVPARQPGGACIFLTDAAWCAIHPLAPFGCAFFDAHMDRAEADQRSLHGLRAVQEAWNAGAEYAHIWTALADAGLVALPPEAARQQLRRDYDAHQPH